MNYALILAGGIGKRLGQSTPKQFLDIGEKPILIHTLDTFYRNDNIDIIVLVCVEEWVDKARELVDYYFPDCKKIKLVNGGENRIESTLCGCEFIIENYITSDDDIIVTHDSVRPFVNDDIINKNIDECKCYDAITTAVKSIDTMLMSFDGDNVNEVPDRNIMYNIQTPQTFKIKELYDLLKKIEPDNNFTDLCGVYKHFGKDVYIVEGNYNNYKITTSKDLEEANNLLK